MKKILLLFVLLFPIFAMAESMCVKNGSVMVILDPQVSGSSNGYSNTGKTWSTKFSYGIISGIGGCYSNVGATQGGVASDQNITPYTAGNHCYCKMLKPAESMWVYGGRPSSCANDCANNCASYAGSALALREGLFGNIIEY